MKLSQYQYNINNFYIIKAFIRHLTILIPKTQICINSMVALITDSHDMRQQKWLIGHKTLVAVIDRPELLYS